MKYNKILNLMLLGAVCMILFANEAKGQENSYPGQKKEPVELHPYTYAEVFGDAPVSATKIFENKQFTIVPNDGDYYYGKKAYGVKVPSMKLKYSNANGSLGLWERFILVKSGGKYYFILTHGKTKDEVNAVLRKIGPPDKK